MESPRWKQQRPSQTKLKDSCDMCSACKVRCTKEKPSCARCRKYNHVCCYSPARRIGRPHRSNLPYATPAVSPVPTAEADAAVAQHNAASTSSVDSGAAYSSTYDDSYRADMPATSQPGTPFPPPRRPCDQPKESSCATVVLDIMENLSAQLQQHELAAPSHRTTTSLLTTSSKSLSRVLICPCSQRLDVALLCVAVCNTMLDLIEAAIRSPPYDNSSYNGGSSLCGRPGVGMMTQVTSDLHQVANLIVHFTSRYDHGELDDELRDALPGLAVELRLRLQETMDEATEDTAEFDSMRSG